MPISGIYLLFYRVHHIMIRIYPALFFRLETLPEPGDRLIHSLVRQRESGALLVFVGSILKAPGFRVDIDSESSAVFSVIAAEEIAHSVMAAGKRLLFQSPERNQSLVDHVSNLLSLTVGGRTWKRTESAYEVLHDPYTDSIIVEKAGMCQPF